MSTKINKIGTLLCGIFIISLNVCSYETKKAKACDSDTARYVFSWPLSNDCDDKPRGGTSKGVSTVVDPKPHSGWLALREPGLSDFEKDRLAILAMAGPYRVDFNFLETVGFSENYKRDKPYHSWGTEYVYVLEDQPKFISLQHIMVMYFKQEDGTVSEPMVMKHWRQDWTYEDDELLVYDYDNSWKKQKVDKKNRKGRWSQAVFQVDDSPRYESIGRWYHNGSFSSWRSDRTRRPLPRREYSVRDDYQVLIGYNRHTINRFGWVQEEENWKKALNEDGSSKEYLAKEEGIGRYQRIIETDFSPGVDYLEVTGDFWKDVRLAWKEVLNRGDSIKLNKKHEGVSLFMPLFEYAQSIVKKGAYDEKSGKEFIHETIKKYVVN